MVRLNGDGPMRVESYGKLGELVTKLGELVTVDWGLLPSWVTGGGQRWKQISYCAFHTYEYVRK